MEDGARRRGAAAAAARRSPTARQLQRCCRAAAVEPAPPGQQAQVKSSGAWRPTPTPAAAGMRCNTARPRGRGRCGCGAAHPSPDRRHPMGSSGTAQWRLRSQPACRPSRRAAASQLPPSCLPAASLQAPHPPAPLPGALAQPRPHHPCWCVGGSLPGRHSGHGWRQAADGGPAAGTPATAAGPELAAAASRHDVARLWDLPQGSCSDGAGPGGSCSGG